MAYKLTDYPFDMFQEMVKKTPTVLFPIGIIEQHGHHLPLGTDIFNCEEPIRLGFDKLNCFVAPGFHYCFSGGGIIGTMNCNPQIFGLMASNICSEFIRMGFKNIGIVLGHGGSENLEALKTSVQLLLREEKNKDIAICLIGSSRMSEICKENITAEPQHDFHAGLTETSRMMYWRPELVHMDRLVMDEPYISEMMRTDQDWYEHKEKCFDDPTTIERVTQREEIKIGVMGFPEKASREIGEQIANQEIASLVEIVDRLNARVLNK